MKERTKNADIEYALENFAGGSQTELASLIGGKCGQGHVHQWLFGLKKPSPHYAKQIERITDGEVKASRFYPEIFGDEHAGKPHD